MTNLEREQYRNARLVLFIHALFWIVMIYALCQWPEDRIEYPAPPPVVALAK